MALRARDKRDMTVPMGNRQRLTDLLVAHLFEIAEQDDFAMMHRQGLKGLLDRFQLPRGRAGSIPASFASRARGHFVLGIERG